MLLRCWTLLLLVWASASSAVAATFDPDLQWRTLQTDHFSIHFHQGEEAFADHFASTIEDVYAQMTDELLWTPRERTQIVLIDRTDDANGYARSVPYNAIVIYVTAPREDSSLGLYEDWPTSIAAHELTHVLHMDANHGIVRLARSVIGRIASTNALSPMWIIEGLATFEETRHTAGGRGRAAIPDMIKRTAIIEDDFPRLGNLDGIQPFPPAGNLRYLFGQDFIQYVADTRGRYAWTEWVHTYGSSLPYLLPAKKVFGDSFQTLYREWQGALEVRYHAQRERIEASGVREGRVVSDTTDSCVAPAFSPDGRWLVWSCYDLKRGSSIWLANGKGEEPTEILIDRGASRFTWRGDSQAFAYAGNHLVNRFNVFSDVYLYELGAKGPIALTQGARARDPDFSPDGGRLWVVTNRVGQTALEELTVDRRRTRLTPEGEDVQYSTPRHSPDGRTVAVSLWENGRRDLWLLDPAAERRRRLTADTHIEADPVWSADGRLLFFTSDRSGVPNIYAIEVEDETLWQVTQVVTGATKPSVSPDGQRLAYQHYSANGWDVRVMPLVAEDWIERGPLPLPARHRTSMAALSQPVDVPPLATGDSPSSFVPESARRGWRRQNPTFQLDPQSPEETLDSFEDAEGIDVFGDAQAHSFVHEPKPYNPLPTLAPRFVAPFVQTTPFQARNALGVCLSEGQCLGLQANLAAGSADVLSRYAWNAFVNYRSDADAWGGGANLTVNRWLPVYSFGVSTRAISTGRYAVLAELTDGSLEPAYTDTRYWERRSSSYAQVSFPYRLRSSVFARYTYTDRQAIHALPQDAYTPLLPLRGRTGALSAGYRYAWSQPTALSISREDGRIASVVANFLHPALGTSIELADGSSEPLTQLQLTTELREYVVAPWADNHVLAGQASAGVALGGTSFLGNYQLGGAFGDSAFYVTPDEFRMLRGYPFGYDLGDMYWLTGMEYRFPLWHIHRGFGTLPAYLRSLSGNVFVDAGNAFASPASQDGSLSLGSLWEQASQDTLVGVGGELLLGSVVAYRSGLTFRLGCGFPMTQRDVSVPPASVYLQLGGSF